MDEVTLEANRLYCARMMEDKGYAPNPECEKCNGFGKIHPRNHYDNKIDYSSVIECDCLKNSKRGSFG